MANDISLIDRTETSLTIKASNLRTGGGEKTILWFLDGDKIVQYGLGASTESDVYTFYGLEPNTTYTISFTIWYKMQGWSDEYSEPLEVSTLKSEEPEDPEPTWDFAYAETYSNIETTKEGSKKLGAGEVLRINMTFKSGGEILFETVDASGAYIFLSSQSSFDEISGEPVSSLTDDYSRNGDASIEWLVSPGVDYYLFVRHYDIEDSGKITYRIVVPEKTRPNTFQWTNPKEKGKDFNLTAKEWNDLCQNVNDLLAYCDQWDYPFTKAVKEESFTAEMFNEILEAIKPISKKTPEYLESREVKAGDIIKAQDLKDLVALVNEIQ